MHIRLLTTAATLLVLTGCAVEPAPYYGGSAPYYGTTYVPTYVGVGVYGGGYYPHYNSHAIHSGYANGYWHYQHQHAAAAHPGGAFHGGAPHAGGAPRGGEPHGGGGHEEGGHH